ncbi:MAG TPA: thioredoxin family protein [Chitinispirillaceae bacterium]|nr:thioredoxin family protein [Chitinispirillaceae bacterium]
MSATTSTMLTLGTEAPEFSLFDTLDNQIKRDDFRGAKALLVVFMSNHCPYVKHIRKNLVSLITEYQNKGVAAVGINSNDVDNYPDDSPSRMAEDASEYGYTFPYLFDASQSVAKAYRAACTPDFFLFDSSFKLVYRGQMDDSRPGNGKENDGRDLRSALDAVLEERPVSEVQKPSMGCSIKWKYGNEPEYFREE